MAEAKPILSAEEIQRFVDLGLGRGVDSTNPRPWLNKTSFQVRNATFSNIIGTDEGGFIQTFKSQVTSNSDLQAQFKASAGVPNIPLSFSLEGELSRSSNSSKRAIGKKVVNRTISFRTHPLSPESQTSEDEISIAEDQSQVSSILQPTFEEVLSSWLWKEVCDRKGLKASKKEVVKASGIAHLNEYLQTASKDEISLIVDDCAEFVRSFGVTHYVSSITLGASEHTIMTESEYSTLLKQSSKVSATQLASAEQKLTARFKTSKSASTKQYLGKIIDDKVKKSSSDEVVIGVKILPIHSLVQNQLICLALQKAVTEYADNSESQHTGPYVVECGDEQMYWKVRSRDSEHFLTTTKDFKQASLFHVIPDEETDDPFDFSIGWQGEVLQDVIDQDHNILAVVKNSKMMRFLEVRTFFIGHYPGPLKLKSELSAKDSKLCLYSQIEHDYFDSPSDVTPWIEGNKVFFVSSANSKSFIAVQRSRNAEPESEYTTKCVGSQKHHDEKNTWMLFRLRPAWAYANDAEVQHSKKVAVSEGSQKKMKDKLDKFLEQS